MVEDLWWEMSASIRSRHDGVCSDDIDEASWHLPKPSSLSQSHSISNDD